MKCAELSDSPAPSLPLGVVASCPAGLVSAYWFITKQVVRNRETTMIQSVRDGDQEIRPGHPVSGRLFFILDVLFCREFF